MNDINIKKELKRCILFSKLNEREIGKIASISSIKSMPRKNLVFSEGDESTGFYIVVKGSVKLFNLSEDGKERILNIIRPGDSFAESSSFSGELHPFFGETKQKSVLIYIPIFQFKDLITREPLITLNMLSALTRFLREIDWRIIDSSSKDVTARLAVYISELLTETQNSENHPIVLKLDIKKTQLAAKLGATNETISRSFGKLKSLGILDIRGKSITLFDPDKLIEITRGNPFK